MRGDDATVNIQHSLWPLKFLAVAGSLGGALFLPEPALFGVYAEVARVLSLLWMLFQVRCGRIVCNQSTVVASLKKHSYRILNTVHSIRDSDVPDPVRSTHVQQKQRAKTALVGIRIM